MGLLFALGQLTQGLCRPLGEAFLLQHTNEICPVPAGFLAITQTGAADAAPDGPRSTAKAVMGQPELTSLVPITFLEGVRGKDQNPALIVQFFIGTRFAVLRPQQLQLLIRIPDLTDELVHANQSRVYRKVPVCAILWDICPTLPVPVCLAEPILDRAQLLERIGKDKIGPFEAPLLQNVSGSPRLKYSIATGITANSRLNLSGAGNIGPETLLPPVQLPTPSSLCLGVGVKIRKFTVFLPDGVIPLIFRNPAIQILFRTLSVRVISDHLHSVLLRGFMERLNGLTVQSADQPIFCDDTIPILQKLSADLR